MIQLALQSKAHTSIIPLQDILGLDSEARMNIPGTIEGNWVWRFNQNLLSDGMIERMRSLTQESGRMG
jgi:4-alpha-glucanotransferase